MKIQSRMNWIPALMLAIILFGIPHVGFSTSRFLESVGDDLWVLPDGRVINGLILRKEGILKSEARSIQEPDREEPANEFYRTTFPAVYAYAGEHDINMAGDVLESCFSFRMLLLRSPYRDDPQLWERWERYYGLYHCLANFIPQPVITVQGSGSLNQYRGVKLYDMTDLYFRDLRAWFLGEPLLHVDEAVFPRNQVFFDFFGTGLDGWKRYVDTFFLQGYVTGDTYEVLELFPRDHWNKKIPETRDEFDTLLTRMQERFVARAKLLEQSAK